jgi:ADP-heptose:LPS heptosyltransferase
VEPLADSFSVQGAAAYEHLMRAWIPAVPVITPVIPPHVNVVYVLSRVTLGADIKIVSPILDAMKRRFPDARIVFVANGKSAELFQRDSRVEHLQASYPRSGSIASRIEFAHELREQMAEANAIVVDPDSRISQLGLIPLCDPVRYFHFPSRTVGTEKSNLSGLVNVWLFSVFGVTGAPYIAPVRVRIGRHRRCAAVNLGVGENESKRIGGDFETKLLNAIGAKYETVFVDRGAGGEEARRVTSAVDNSAVADRVRYWEGGFAGFTSIIARSDLYVGYDSGGQHAAGAAGVPLICIFAGAASERFRHRWSAADATRIIHIVADGRSPDEVLSAVEQALPLDY